MADKIELKMKWREHRDGDIGRGRHKCFDIHIQDCDGDYAEWDIKRGDVYIARGTEGDPEKAEAKLIEVLGYLCRAVDFNDFVQREYPRLKAQGIA